MEYGQIFGFTGLNRNTSPFLKEEGEYPDAQNFSTRKIGVLKKTGDYQIKNAQITASQDILGGIDFARADGTNEHFVAIDGASNAEIYKDVTGTWTSQSQSLTKNEKVRFAQSPTLDELFAVKISDASRVYDGSSWSTGGDVTSSPKGKFAIVFGRRVYILNADVGGTLYPSRAYRSSLVDSGSITWDTTNDWFVFDDVISGSGTNGENMVVLCDNSTHLLTPADEKYRISGIGCVSNEGIVSYDRWTFYPARTGYYMFDGTETRRISLGVQDFWDNIPEANLSSILAGRDGDYIYVYIGDITHPDDSTVTLSNTLLEYDINQNDWNKISLGVEAKNLHSFVTSSGRKLFMGDDDGKVYQMFTSGLQDTADFSTYLETDWFYGSGQRNVDTFKELWGHGNNLSALKVSYKVDDGDWQGIAGELKGSSSVVKYSVKGRRIKYLLEETSGNNLFEVDLLEPGYVPGYTKHQ